MRLECPDCHFQVEADDAKIPQGPFKARCSKCGKIYITSREQISPPEPAPPKQIHSSVEWERIRPAVENFVRSQIDSLKNELSNPPSTQMDAGSLAAEVLTDERSVKKALVCEEDHTLAEAISQVLIRLGYSVDVSPTAMDSIKRLDGRPYHLITLNLSFADDAQGGQKILSKINGDKQEARRNVFVVIISAAIKTTDASSAFLQGANIMVNKEDIKQLENMIIEGQRQFYNLYQNYYEILESSTDRL